MNDTTNSIPFEFEDCDSFLTSLDDNNNCNAIPNHHQKQQQFQQQQQLSYQMTNFSNANPDLWVLNQQDSYMFAQQQPQQPQQQQPQQPQPQQQHNGPTAQQPYILNSMNLDSTNYLVPQQTSYYNNPESSSSASSPLSSPSMSVNSISDTDNTANFSAQPVFPQSYPPSQTILQQPSLFTNNTAVDNPYNTLASHPVSPPYPSAESSSGEPGTSPEEDYSYNDPQNFLVVSQADSAVPIADDTTSSPIADTFKQEASELADQIDDTEESKPTDANKLKKFNKISADTKSGKITKPKKEKTSHNMIEKRYRTNINDKILALRDCVPSLRCVVTGGTRPSEDLDGLTPASKLNKATVLTKATEYILHLQKRNALLMKELNETRQAQGVATMDMQMMPNMGGIPPNVMPAYPQPQHNPNYMSKAMMLSMAGMMGAGLMNNGEMQGLSAVPFFSFFSSTARFGPWTGQQLLFTLKLTLILGTVLSLVVPSLFDSSAPKDKKHQMEYSVEEASDETHSLSEMRKQTWITNSRNLNIPSTNFSSQAFSFLRCMFQVVLVNFAGVDAYAAFANFFDNEQLSEKRASLSRAIDAQLCGGDDSPDLVRLIYTFIKSFILPASSTRYLNQALHFNVICNGTMFEKPGSYLTMYLWNKAKAMANESSVGLSEEDSNYVPKNTCALLNNYNLDSPETNQRLQNVVYGLPVSDGCLTGEDDEGYNSVVIDKSIRSVSDLLAAVHANSLLHGVLVTALDDGEPDLKTLALCSKIAPPRSIVARRVAIIEALLLGPKDASYVKNAMDMLKEELDQQTWFSQELAQSRTNRSNSLTTTTTNISSLAHNTLGGNAEDIDDFDDEDDLDVEEDDFTISSRSSSIMSGELNMSDSDSVITERGEDAAFLSSCVKTTTTPFVVSQDSRIGIRCALIICYLSRNSTSAALQLIQKIEINKLENIGLLGFVAIWKVLKQMHERKCASNRNKLEDLSAVARVWLGGNTGAQEGISLSRLRNLIGESVEMNKYFGGYECDLDEGYGTQ